MRCRNKGFRDQRGVKLQEKVSGWPNQMHSVPQQVGKMQRGCPGRRDMDDLQRLLDKGVAGTTARAPNVLWDP